MSYEIRLLATEEVLFTVPPEHRDLILSELVKLAQQPPADAPPLRVGDWMISYELDNERQVLRVISIQSSAPGA